MLEIRYVRETDRDFWYCLDNHLPEKEFTQKVEKHQGYVLLADDKPIGLLRYQLFWDNTPFCTMLYINEKHQNLGYGRQLMEHWEKDMRENGYGMTLTSTRADETAQHFYRKLGYRICGGFVIDIKGYEQPLELFMAKGL